MSRRCFMPFSRSNNVPPPTPYKVEDNQPSGKGLADKVESQLSKLNMKTPPPNKPIPTPRNDNFEKKPRRKNITMNF